MDQIDCIYLIGCDANTLVKIGRSNDVQARFTALQTMSPVKLTLLWQTLGGAELETALHRRFEDRRSHGEWFDFPDGDAVARITEALPKIAAEMQRMQRRQVSRMVERAKVARAAAELAAAKPDTRERARDILLEDPDINAAELARRLGKNPSGYIRQLRSDVLAGLRDAGELPSVRSIGA